MAGLKGGAGRICSRQSANQASGTGRQLPVPNWQSSRGGHAAVDQVHLSAGRKPNTSESRRTFLENVEQVCSSCGASRLHQVFVQHKLGATCLACLPEARRRHPGATFVDMRGPAKHVCGLCESYTPVWVYMDAAAYAECTECRGRAAPAARQEADAADALLLRWEILPRAELGRMIQRFWFAGAKKGGARLCGDRLDHLRSLRPERMWRGFLEEPEAAYVVAELEVCVVAESLVSGNAIYICEKAVGGSSWQHVLRHSKKDARLLGASRITHQGEWKLRLQAEINRLGAGGRARNRRPRP